MRILVLSDSHFRSSYLPEVLAREADADLIFHLGDGAPDMIPLLPGIRVPCYLLRGNCDPAGMTETEEKVIVSRNGIKILAAHGHRYHVKYSPDRIGLEAQLEGCRLVLYGHTHEPSLEYEGGITLFNPGALQDGRYGIAEIRDNGILCTHKILPAF